MRAVSTAVIEMLDRLDGESRRYTAKMFDTIEEERRRIGRELHDDTSQTLAAALINLELVDKGLDDGCVRRLQAGREHHRPDPVLPHQIKLLVYDLRPSMLDDLGLVPALRWYIQSHLQASELEVETDFEARSRSSARTVETALYRIAQESLANVVKHSMATRSHASVSRSSRATPAWPIIDNGDRLRARTRSSTTKRGGSASGLLSIKERIELLDGTVTIDSAHGKGTHLHVVVPLEEVETA